MRREQRIATRYRDPSPLTSPTPMRVSSFLSAGDMPPEAGASAWPDGVAVFFFLSDDAFRAGALRDRDLPRRGEDMDGDRYKSKRFGTFPKTCKRLSALCSDNEERRST